MGDLIQFIPRSNPKPVTINIWPDISPLECMAIDIVNEIFPRNETLDLDAVPVGSKIVIRNTMRQKPIEAPAEYNYQAPADDPA